MLGDRFDLIEARNVLLPVAIEALLCFVTSSLCRSKRSPINCVVFTSVIDTMLTFVDSFCTTKQPKFVPWYSLREEEFLASLARGDVQV